MHDLDVKINFEITYIQVTGTDTDIRLENEEEKPSLLSRFEDINETLQSDARLSLWRDFCVE